MNSVFDITQKEYTIDSLPFLDPHGPVTVARYDKMRYKEFDKLSKKQKGFFWQPEEVSLVKDIKDFHDLADHEKHIFTSNLKRQTLLDSVQGRAPLMLLDICSIPELENWIISWSFSELVHSESYTYIIRNIYSNPSKIFDELMDIEPIVDCAKDISFYYDSLKSAIIEYQSGKKVSLYDLKKKLWLCINSINALEGIRFFVSFCCSWSFAELKKMEGNAKIIKLIARDENVHLASTQLLLKILRRDDPDFTKIALETEKDVYKIFHDVVEQEKAWADYLFRDGSIIGLNANILKEYVEWVAGKRMKAVGLNDIYKISSNPLQWSQKWIAGADVQTANQEVENSSYISGGLKQDLTNDILNGMKL